MTNREKLIQEFNENPDKYLYFYNCVIINGESDCTNCVIVNSKGNKHCRVAYKEWLDEDVREEE